MIYLNENDIKNLGIDWFVCTKTIEEAVKCLATYDTVQPIKPYLRFKNLKNRIIAMPAYVGGSFDIAGIKWIASFPENIRKNIPRASSIIILNDSDTGKVVSVINTVFLSVIRTVSVSALVLRYFLSLGQKNKLTVGIIGWGPIGQNHFKMCEEIFDNQISKIVIYDIKNIQQKDIETHNKKIKVVIAKDWREAYEQSDVVITCTVSDRSYIDKKPKPGSLLLNVSLRDYKIDIYKYVKDSIIVDDWNEVCREKTDIEFFHKECGLKKENVKTIVDVVVNGCLESYDQNIPIMFNPMGMGIFDIAIAKHYVDLARKNNVGLFLE
ncbi:MAG: 2,3-diaminopropionate biosynthesis protein SbnB [Patescibacteria group bacterium]